MGNSVCATGRRRGSYRTVLFDFDGTLTPSLELWVRSFREALRRLGLDFSEQEVIRRCFHRSFEHTALDLGLASAAELRQCVLEVLNNGLKSADLFPSVRETLAHCRERGVQMGIVTSAPRAEVLGALATFNIDAYFGVLVSADDVQNFKPHPEPVRRALSALGAEPETTLFVGDYLTDVLAGQAAGAQTALFLPPEHERFFSFEALRATGPDFVFTEHSELLTYLKET